MCSIHPMNPATTVAFEEPENGLHPTRIQIIIRLLKNASQNYGKQIIITTHSPLLAQCFEPEDLFVCQKKESQTTIKALSYGGLFKNRKNEEGLLDRILRGDFGG